ncbi:MAG: hypothetical protein HY350_02300 [Candidatus Omnitrophica bacterium]|nr:hypothetical protein [Candidatus Omnitrophota bacterium]
MTFKVVYVETSEQRYNEMITCLQNSGMLTGGSYGFTSVEDAANYTVTLEKPFSDNDVNWA